MRQALRELTSKGMRRLVLDIRGNPGGPLDQAIKVSNEFLPRGKMIVYTRGRISNSDQDYRGDRGRRVPDIPMVVLMNREQRERIGDRRPARCRITTAPTSSARRRSARRSCSRSTASAAAPAWR